MSTPAKAKTIQTQAIGLKAFNYGEHDKIVHFYTPTLGRVSAIVKGARKATSKLSGACSPLHESTLHLNRGQSSLYTLLQYQSTNGHPNLRADILRMALGTLMAELVDITAAEHDQDSQAVFDLLQAGLAQIEHCHHDDEVLLSGLLFQLHLQQILGYGVDYSHGLIHNQPLQWDEPYYCFSQTMGGVISPKERYRLPSPDWVNISTSTLKMLAAPTETLQQWVQDRAHLPESAASLFEKPYRFLIYSVEQRLDKAVKSATFLLTQLKDSSALDL